MSKRSLWLIDQCIGCIVIHKLQLHRIELQIPMQTQSHATHVHDGSTAEGLRLIQGEMAGACAHSP